MKFTADATTFGEAVKRASVTVERSSIPILDNLCLTVGEASVSLFGTNMDCEITATVPATVAVQGATTVNAKGLGALAKGWGKGSLVEMELIDGRVIVRNGRSSSSLSTLPPADVPYLTDRDRPHRFAIPAATLLGEINTVRHAISTEETRYYLINGILWEGTNGALRMVTTDGHRLAKSDMVAPEGAGEMPRTIVPRLTIEYLRKLLAGKNTPVVHVEVGALQLRFVCGAVEMKSKIVDGTYPDYNRAIPRSNGIEITAERNELANTLSRLVKLTTRGTTAVLFDAAGDNLSLTAKNIVDGTSAEESIPARLVKGPIQIGFNGRYVLDMLAAMTGQDVTLHLSDAGAPVLVSEGSREFVLMPMRV